MYDPYSHTVQKNKHICVCTHIVYVEKDIRYMWQDIKNDEFG